MSSDGQSDKSPSVHPTPPAPPEPPRPVIRPDQVIDPDWNPPSEVWIQRSYVAKPLTRESIIRPDSNTEGGQ